MESPMSTTAPWELVAHAYLAEVVPMFEPYVRDALALAKPATGGRIVDVACGPGTLAVIAADTGHVVDAIDFSPAMIKNLEARIGTRRITARVADGQALPFDAAIFDAAFSMFGLMFFPDRAKGFAELRRVLKPGARAVIATWTRLEDTPLFAAMFGALRETMSKLLGPKAPPNAAPDLPLTTPESCRAEMGHAFADVEVHRVPHNHRYASLDALWSSLERTMAPIALMKRNFGDRWPVLAEAATTAMSAVAGTGPVELTMPGLLSVGVAR